MFTTIFNKLLENFIEKSDQILPNSTLIPLDSSLDQWLNHNVVYKWWIDSLHIPVHSLMPNPASMQKKDFLNNVFVYSNFYQVSLKDDGIRYSLYFCKNEQHCNFSFMMNRIGQKFIVKFNTCDDIYNGTVFDGEWILKQQGQNKFYEYKIFDIIAVYGNHIVQNCSFYDRIHVIKHILNHVSIDFELKQQQEKYNNAINNNISVKLSVKPWLNIKDMYHLKSFFNNQNFKHTELDNVSDNNINNNQPHYWYNYNTFHDGLIFIPTLLPVGRGMQINMFKWKNKHTIDLKLVVSMIDNGTKKLLNIEFFTKNDPNYTPPNNFLINNNTKIVPYYDLETNQLWDVYFQPLIIIQQKTNINDNSNVTNETQNLTATGKKRKVKFNTTSYNNIKKNTTTINNVKLTLNNEQPLFKNIYEHILQEQNNHNNSYFNKNNNNTSFEYDPTQPSFIADTTLQRMFVNWSQIEEKNRILLSLSTSNTTKSNNNPLICINAIVECNTCMESNNNYYLKIEKIRTDKLNPNPDFIVLQTLENEQNNIMFDEMLNLIDNIPQLIVHNK